MRERLYGLVSPDTDGLVTADQVVERVANTKAVGEEYSEINLIIADHASSIGGWLLVRKILQS